jgi:PqqD family protein of HPr-rel-A system
MVSLSRLTLPSEGLAFDPATGDTFMLNDSGAWILKAFQIGHSKSEIISMLREEFQISQEEAARDVTDFHGRLQHLQLVSRGTT